VEGRGGEGRQLRRGQGGGRIAGIELKTAPEGYVKVDANHHLWSKSRIAVGQPDASSRWSPSRRADQADPFPKGYQ
jgi:urea transport system substrate-binding protein